MKWSIITDSSCDLRMKYWNEKIDYHIVPFSFQVGNTEFIDSEGLDISKLFEEMEQCKEQSKTACPSPGKWYEYFSQSDCSIAITISSKLSGSYNSAVAAMEMAMEEYPQKEIYVLDSKTAGPALAILVAKTHQYIKEGLPFQDIVKRLENEVNHFQTLFALSSFENLVKSGRVSRLSGILAEKLNMKGIGGGKDGEIVMKQKVRGNQKLLQYIIEDMKKNEFAGDVVGISHCQNWEMAYKLRDEIKKIWKDTKVIMFQTGGLCSYYAEKQGLIISY